METAKENKEVLDLSNPVAVSDAVRKNQGKPVTVQVYFLTGIFGELENCNGVAEEVIDTDEKLAKYGLDPKEGGTYIKLIGCSYLYKGNPEQSKVFGMEQAKSNISTLPRDIIARSWLYSAAVGLRALFRPRRFVNDLHVFFGEIKHKTIRHCTPPEIRLAKFTREIRRAMDVALRKELKIDPALDLYNSEPSVVKYTDVDLAGMITKAVAFVTLMIEQDGAYRFPMQDMFGELDKENAARSGAREMIRLANLMVERNTNLTVVPGISDRTEGVPHKLKFIRNVLRALFWLSPLARRITQTFLLELDVEKVALDDADWYFCLRRNTHNYRGVPLPDRLRELEMIDKLRGHSYVKIEFVKAPSGTPKAEATLETPKP